MKKSQKPSKVFGQVLVVLAAGVLALAPLPPGWIERGYSTGLYPRIQRPLTTISNLVPVVLLDVLIVLAILGSVGALVYDLRSRPRRWLRAAGRFVVRTVVAAAVLYLAFLATWGLNYRRVSLPQKLIFDEAAITPEALAAAASTSVEQLNTLADRAHASGWTERGAIDADLAGALARVSRDFGLPMAPVAARPKVSLLDFYFRRAGVEGMTDPYFLETLVQGGLLPFERPFVAAHEWAHLAGFADEAEANFVGWLTCLRGSVPDQYSGWLFLYSELSRAVRGRDRAAIAAQLGPQPRADLNAMADRYRRQVNQQVSAAGWRVYDGYLKANRVAAGTVSYSLVVRLVLGAKFGPDWTPLLRNASASSPAGSR